MSAIRRVTLSSLFLLVACSSGTDGSSEQGATGDGGASSSGGTSANGGTSSSGGTSASGGASSGGAVGVSGGAGGLVASGGATDAGLDVDGSSGEPSDASAGGSAQNGGAPNAGGASNGGSANGTGGVTSSGGNVGAGGASSGGANGSGGTLSTGGTTSTGGTSSGGTSSNGGTTSTGGTTSMGGASSSGGASSTGGASSSGGAPSADGGVPQPEIGGCTVFPPDNPWNTDIYDAMVHSRNAQYLAAFDVDPQHRAIHLDLGSTEDFYGIPHAVVPANQSTVAITYGVGGENYWDESDPGPFPLPLDAHIEGQAGTTDPTGGDRHVIIVQQGTCLLFELYKAVRTTSPAGFRCASSAKWDLNSNAGRTPGWTSADAAGLPIFPGLLRYAEIQAGAIHHALRVTAPNAQNAYIAPASHTGPNDDATLPPYGLRVRLKKSFSETGYSKDALVLIHALKHYGLMYADQGTGWYVSGSSDPALDNLISEIHSKRPIPSSAFEAVYTGDAKCGWGTPGACN